jgi:hypothetical protein
MNFKAMIKVTDLKIGNLLIDPQNNICRVWSIEGAIGGTKEYILCEWIDGCETEDPSTEIEDYRYIPLTEEWLLKFGFEKDTYWKINIEQGGKNCLWYNPNTKEIIIALYDFGDNECGMPTNVKYVHQIQNLFHALTGEELEIKNPD